VGFVEIYEYDLAKMYFFLWGAFVPKGGFLTPENLMTLLLLSPKLTNFGP